MTLKKNKFIKNTVLGATGALGIYGLYKYFQENNNNKFDDLIELKIQHHFNNYINTKDQQKKNKEENIIKLLKSLIGKGNISEKYFIKYPNKNDDDEVYLTNITKNTFGHSKKHSKKHLKKHLKKHSKKHSKKHLKK